MEEKRRKQDNGIRKFVNPGWAVVILLIASLIVTFVSNVKTIPATERRSYNNEKRIDKIEWKLDHILSEVKDIKNMLKK